MPYDCKDAEPVVGTSDVPYGNNDEYKYIHPFTEAGDYEYTFRFSTDNGNNWIWINAEWENSDHIAYAKILAPEPGQFANADFKYWSGNKPQVWEAANTVTTSKWDRGDANGFAAKVTAVSSLSAKDIFTSGEFVVPDGKIAKEITFDMATDQAIKPKIGINCGSTKWYGWDSTEGHNYFSASKSSFVSIDFGDNNTLHPTSVQLDSTVTTGTCKLIVRYTADANAWAAFDNFTVVYEDAE